MEQQDNNKPEELESDEMNNSLRDETEALNTLGDDEQATPTPPTLSKGSEEFSFKNGQYEINISSSVLRADYLMNLCLGFLEEFKKDKPNNKPGDYVR